MDTHANACRVWSEIFGDNAYILNKGQRGHAMLPSSASSREGAEEQYLRSSGG